MHRTLALHKGGRSISTRHGMRRILKHRPSAIEYIEKAVETGIYRTSDEIDVAMDAIRKGHAGDDSVIEPRVAVNRFRRDIIRGTEVQDYPAEYHILMQHPPIPVPPRVPKKIQRRMQREQPKHPTQQLVQKYLKRQPKSKATTEDYYRKLLGVQPPAENYSMGQKSSALSKAYAYSVKQYEVMRTQDVSEKEALAIVDELLAEETKEERHRSREITQKVQDWDKTGGDSSSTKDDQQKGGDDSKGSSSSSVQENLPSILHGKPRVVEGMMQWSHMLQNSGIPYSEWTVGASTALDHWIARNILELSEATWDALLEGNDPSLLSRGQDIVALRETLFPETRLDVREEDMLEQEHSTFEEEEEESFSSSIDVPQPAMEKTKSVDELLNSLRGLDRIKDEGETPQTATWSFDDDTSSTSTPAPDHPAETDPIRMLTEELQEWRAQNSKSPYEQWPEHEQQRFSAWLNRYIETLTSAVDRPLIDREETRKALLSDAPQSEEESNNFWNSLQDETKADLFLQNLLQKGPPDGLSDTEKVFWTLPYEQQLEKLVNLGTVRPLFDEYMSDEQRRDFLRRYGDYLLDGVEMDHLVRDPHGPVSAMDLGIEAIREWGIHKEDRFRLVKLPYRSGMSDSMSKGGDDSKASGSDVAMERSRALFKAWNQHKAGRARYEETLFVRGDLGLTYGSKTPNELKKEQEDEEKKYNK